MEEDRLRELNQKLIKTIGELEDRLNAKDQKIFELELVNRKLTYDNTRMSLYIIASQQQSER